ncbi:hypothetical protein AAF712_016653, partial [Marasmius tenuissimus]
MSSYLSNARDTTIGANANFQTVAGNSTITHNNNYISERENQITVKGRKVRTVIDGDIEFLRLLSSKILPVKVKRADEPSTSSESQVVQVKKTVQTAKIFGCQGKFTATTLETVNEMDQEAFQE